MRAALARLVSGEVLRFGLVGIANTAIDLGLYFVLQRAGVPILLANLLSTSAGLTFSFVANRLFTFSARPARRSGTQLLLFVTTTGVGLWVLQPVIILATGALLGPLTALGDLRILAAKVVAIGFGVVWNWFLYSRVVFRAARPLPKVAAELAPTAAGAA